MVDKPPKTPGKVMQAKHDRFATEFVATQNIAEAYRRAFKPRSKNKATHKRAGSRIRHNPVVAAKIAEIQLMVDKVGLGLSADKTTEIDRIKDGTMTFSKNDILAELHKAYHMAEIEKDYSAMQNISSKKAAILGFGTEDKGGGGGRARNIMEYTDDELIQLAESSLRNAADLTAGLTADPVPVATGDEDGKSGAGAGGDKGRAKAP